MKISLVAPATPAIPAAEALLLSVHSSPQHCSDGGRTAPMARAGIYGLIVTDILLPPDNREDHLTILTSWHSLGRWPSVWTHHQDAYSWPVPQCGSHWSVVMAQLRQHHSGWPAKKKLLLATMQHCSAFSIHCCESSVHWLNDWRQAVWLLITPDRTGPHRAGNDLFHFDDELKGVRRANYPQMTKEMNPSRRSWWVGDGRIQCFLLIQLKPKHCGFTVMP